MHDRVVIARKRSTDPAQENLRANKDQWNKGVRDFISRVKTFTSALIELKRAMNGWPVPALGLERSSIKNPLSPVVPNLLDGLANEYQSLAQEYQGLTQSGQSIVHEQEQYSETRQKSHGDGGIAPELPPQPVEQATTPSTVARTEIGLAKEGSNMFSRLLTYIKTPFMFGDDDRYARRDMLKSSAALHKLLGEIGKSIVSKDKNAIPEAVYRTQQFIAQFNSELTSPLLALNEAKAAEMGLPIPPEEKEEPATKPELSVVPKPTVEAPPKKEESPAMPIDTERYPMVVEFGLTRAWQKVVSVIDQLLGMEGKLDTSQSEKGLLRRSYRFPSRDARQQAMVRIRTETTGVNIIHPASGVKTEEPVAALESVPEEPAAEQETQEQLLVPEAPPPPDIDQDQHADEFERLAQVNLWVDELKNANIPRQVSMMAVRLKDSHVEFDVDLYVNQLIRMELGFKEMVRDSHGNLTDQVYQELYAQYHAIVGLFQSLSEAVTKAEQLPKAGAANAELIKFAQARVSRWLSKQWLTLLKTKDYRTRIVADRYVTSVGDSLDRFMDLLQQKKVPGDLLSNQLIGVIEGLHGLLEALVTLAEMHNGQAKIQQLRDRSRRKVSTINVISPQIINSLRRNRDELTRFKAELKEKKELAAAPKAA